MEGIWGLQVAVGEAQWVVPQVHPGSNVQLHCCGTGPGTGGTGLLEEAGPLLPHSPSDDKEIKMETLSKQLNLESKICLLYTSLVELTKSLKKGL